jgi:hypothetical protein
MSGESASKEDVKVGDKMPDGTIYAGTSPDTQQPMFATPADAPGTYTFNGAARYATNLDAHGHQDWRPPTKAELNVLFNNRAAIGGFDLGRYIGTDWYWNAGPAIPGYEPSPYSSAAKYWSSSSSSPLEASFQSFGDGYRSDFGKNIDFHVRCVR